MMTTKSGTHFIRNPILISTFPKCKGENGLFMVKRT